MICWKRSEANEVFGALHCRLTRSAAHLSLGWILLLVSVTFCAQCRSALRLINVHHKRARTMISLAIAFGKRILLVLGCIFVGVLKCTLNARAVRESLSIRSFVQ